MILGRCLQFSATYCFCFIFSENESASAKKDLIAELELLKLIEPHKNVINLLGCCTRVGKR
jgi:hypothetical protein